jgi:hypothetical protein
MAAPYAGKLGNLRVAWRCCVLVYSAVGVETPALLVLLERTSLMMRPITPGTHHQTVFNPTFKIETSPYQKD